MSYLEYGGVLADPAGLESRYCRLRALEDVDELQPSGLGKDPRGPTTRVRFVNYYTLCTGLPRTPKSGTPKSESPKAGDDEEEEVDLIGPQNKTTGAAAPVSVPTMVAAAENTTAGYPTEYFDMVEPKSLLHEKGKLRANHHGSRPSITVEDHDKSMLFAGSSAPNLGTCSGTQSPDPTSQDTTSLPGDLDELSMQEIDPTPMDESSDSATLQTRPSDQSFELDLPPIPDEPTPPELPDLDQYPNKDSRKLAEREAKRLQRVYDQAMKDRSRAIHERERIVEKRRRKASKDAERLAKGARKEAQREEKEARKEMERLEKESRKESERAEKEARKEAERVEKEAQKEAERKEKEAQNEAERKEKEALKKQRRLEKEAQDMERAALAAAAAEARADTKPRKLRQFCNLPDKVPTANGGYERDAAWVEVFMADVDEVGAHCGLFLPGPHYERLVGDVGSRIVGWVQEDLTKRAIMDIGVD